MNYLSKYTTEVRFICEHLSGLEYSTDGHNVDNVISKSWNKIFTTSVPFFDEEYKSVLCSKILKHYYLREICSETTGIWIMWMNERLEMIMPYYNQLYKSATIEFNPLFDVDITRKSTRNIDATKTETGELTRTSNNTRKTDGTQYVDSTAENTTKISDSTESTTKDLYSDTPQGALTGVETETYLTNARKISNNESNSGTENSSSNGTNDTVYNGTTTDENNVNDNTTNNGKSNSTDDYIETLTGKQGGDTYSKMLNEFRSTFLNIDNMIIDEFKDLFFNLW